MSEDEFLRTRGGPVPKRAAIRRVYVSEGVRHTLYTPGAYRTNAQLLYGQYKVDSKHGKVSVALERKTYNNGWGQTSSGWKRVQIEDDNQQEFDPRSARKATPRGGVDQGDYAGHGREKRFGTSCLNAGQVHKSGLGEGLNGFCDGKVEVLYPNGPNPKMQATIRRIAVAPPLDVRISGRRTSNVAVSMWKYGLEPVPKDKLGDWREELAMEPNLRAGSSLVAWQREAGYFRPCFSRQRAALFSTVARKKNRASRTRATRGFNFGKLSENSHELSRYRSERKRPGAAQARFQERVPHPQG